MSLLDKASLIVTPNAYEESKLYSVVPNTTLGDMDVVRATTATRVNASGLIESVGLNIPRIDYTNGSCPSILVEPQRTNLVFPSATLTTQTRTVTAAANTLSFYGTGTIVLSGVHIATLTGTGANNRVSLTFTPTAGSLILTVTGTVTNAQLELGSYATSYIPTVASSVTRNADVISKTGISSLIGQTEGTVFMQYTKLNNVNNWLLSLVGAGGVFNNAFYIATDDTKFYLIAYTNSGSNGGRINTNITPNINQNYKIAFKYNSNSFSIFINGTKFSGTLTGMPVCNAIYINEIGQFSGTDEFHKNEFNSIQLYKTALTDTECINLTTL